MLMVVAMGLPLHISQYRMAFSFLLAAKLLPYVPPCEVSGTSIKKVNKQNWDF